MWAPVPEITSGLTGSYSRRYIMYGRYLFFSFLSCGHHFGLTRCPCRWCQHSNPDPDPRTSNPTSTHLATCTIRLPFRWKGGLWNPLSLFHFLIWPCVGTPGAGFVGFVSSTNFRSWVACSWRFEALLLLWVGVGHVGGIFGFYGVLEYPFL